MNAVTFKSMLTPEMGTNNVTDTDHAAQLLADAYDLANIGSSCTFFGSTVISGDKDTLKKFIKLAFDTNKTTNTKSGFILMATGFCSYWLKAVFTPLPTLPPCISPLKGTTVLFPGEPTELEKDLIKAFDQPEFEMFTDTLYNALVAHHTKIAGTYNGLVPAFPSPIPGIFPWVAILSAPLPDTGTSGTSGTDGTSGTGGTDGGDGAGGTSGTSETDGRGGTGGTSGTSGEKGVGGFDLNGVSDINVKRRILRIVRAANNKFNADWVVQLSTQTYINPIPDSIKREIAFNTSLQKEIGNLKGQNVNRIYYIYDIMIADNNITLDGNTGYVKTGTTGI
jgi:hypothetical protein